MDGKSRSYMRAVCAVLAAGLLAAGCGKEETAAAETAEIAVPEAAKKNRGFGNYRICRVFFRV